MLKALLTVVVNTLTIFIVLFAGLFTLARIGSLFAPNYIDTLNQQFAEQGLEFAELKVKWRGINPVIELGQVTGTNLRAEDVTAELDTLASFWRNTYVFRTIQIEHVSFELTQSSACSIILPEVTGSSFGIDTILRYSNNIDISFSSSIECGSTHIEHEGFFRTIRLNHVYRVHATVRDLGPCDMCYVSFLYETNSSGFWRRQQERLLNIQAHDFVIPTNLLGWDFMAESLVNAQVLMSGTATNASLVGSIDIQPHGQPSAPEKLSLDLGFAINNTGISGKVVATLLDNNSNVISTLEHGVRRNLEAGYIHGWSHEVPVETARTFMTTFGVAGHPMHEWAVGLAPSGTLTSVQWVLDRAGFTYWAAVDDLRIQQHAGFPALALDSVIIAGRGAFVQVIANAQQIDINEADYFSAPMSLTAVDFSTIVTWKQDYFGCSIDGQWDPTSEGEAIVFDIGIQVSLPTGRQWFRLALDIPSVSMTQVQPHLVSFVPAQTFTWIEESILRARFDEANVEFIRITDALLESATTTLEVQALIDETDVIFHTDWPKVVEGTGRFWLTQDALTIDVDTAYSHGNHIEQGKIFLPFSDPLLDLEFTADMTFLLLQSYLVETPLIEQLPFDPLQFDGTGAIDMVASLQIPLSDEGDNLLDVKLDMVLSDVFLDVKPADIQIDDIFGSVGYQFPHQLTSSQLDGNFLDSPVALELSTRRDASGSDEVVISFDLDTSVSAISHLTGDWLHTIASGSTHANGNITFPLAGEFPPFIDASTDLFGVALALPIPFHKTADQNRPMQLRITLDDPLIVDVSMDQATVRAVGAEGVPLRGSIGLNVAPQDLNQSTKDWLVTGNLDELVFATDELSDASLPTGLDIEFAGLHIEKLIRGRFQLHELQLEGTFGGESSALDIRAEEGSATLSRELGQDWQLSVERLRLWHSAFDTPNDTPLDPAVFLQLPSINVSVQELYMFAENGDAEDFGAWSFALDTTDKEVHLRDIVAELRGVNLDTRDNLGIIWDTKENKTRFRGVISGDNLLQVLPQFDVDAEIESENFTVNTDLTWPGSPLDINTLKMSGRIHGDANAGTLLEVGAGQGILRLLSVFNIAPIIQRMDFDPTAMFGKGFNFDRILYDVTLDQSQVIIQEPIHIKGRSSDIRFSGNANLADESLTMEVVVKLPFSNNLKWYVALITGNPTAFLGTIIGSRIFRPQLDRISSAKYKVGGTFESPEVELIGFFNDDLTEEPADDATNNEE